LANIVTIIDKDLHSRIHKNSS